MNLRLASSLIFLGLLSALTVKASADTLGEIQKRGVLRWGGDQSGGAPYVFQEPDGKLTGFEFDLAEALARRLGVRSEFVQGQWDKLPDLLDRGDIDMVLNGYEWSPEHEKGHASTVPYYIYKLQLLARKADASIGSWDDLRGLEKAGHARKRVGVLMASAAEHYMEKNFGDAVDLKSYDGVTNAMTSVEQGQIDATLQDVPIAIHYAKEFPGLREVGEPVAPGYYVIFIGKTEEGLRRMLNEAILLELEDGSLERMYRKYNLWNEDQRQLSKVALDWPPKVETLATGWSDLPSFGLRLLNSAGITIVLSCLSMPLAILIGLMVATGRLYGPRWLSRPLLAYVEVLRGTPLLLQLYVIFYILPDMGIRIPAFWSAVLGLMTSILYLLMSYPLSIFARRLEGKMQIVAA